MIDLTDHWLIPGLTILADWSLRWGVALAVLAVWFAAWPPRRAATRYQLGLAVLGAGLLVPLAPRWGDAVVPVLARSPTAPAPVAVPVPIAVAISAEPMFAPIPEREPSAPRPLAPPEPPRAAAPTHAERWVPLGDRGGWVLSGWRESGAWWLWSV